ncbi:ATP-binding protein [Pseudomonas sp.]|uniref:sensor histidine kinase n=1 Tax=Pseudomonas sp. TaxID=306 RepID=UPI00257E2715|nr:ATP-binding protein [Pseudomonas sp.]
MSRAQRYPLRQWIWRAFVQSALIPLILVEFVLVTVFLVGNEAIREAQVGHLQENALATLSAAATRESDVIDIHLQAVSQQAKILADATARALANKAYTPDAVEQGRHALSDDGVFYSRSDDGRAASFYSNATPVAKQYHAKALRLSQLDPLMRSMHENDSSVAALYFNSWDSYNRIYPYFDVLQRYPADMFIPRYNFYYRADATHNPSRRVVWTDVYVDPAGLGWIMSAVAPVYQGDFLEGVVGLDVTINMVLDQINNLQVPWQGYAVLLNKDNNIMALPAPGERDFGLRELTDYSYAEAIRREVLKPEDFNLASRADMQPLNAAIAADRPKVMELELGGRKQLVVWSEIEQTGWRLLLVVDEEKILSETNMLAAKYDKIGYWLIGGLVLFYLLFILWMWLRSRHLGQELIQGVGGIVVRMRQLGQGQYQTVGDSSRIEELAAIEAAVTQAGEQLQASEIQRLDAEKLLRVVVESTTESMWLIEADLLMISVSERFCKRFSLAEKRMTMAAFNERVHPNDLERVRHLREQFAASGEDHYEAEYRFADANMHYVWLLSRGRVLERDEAGKPLRVAGTHVDISGLKETQEALRLSSLQAQDASQSKSRFLSSMSHELRTPLNAIQGFAQLIEVDAQERENAQQEADYAREIINASRHLAALVDDVLDLSSIENRPQQLQMQPVKIAGVLHGCAELILPELQQRGLRIDVQVPADSALCVQADARRLRQVLLNLLSNAMKYSRESGLITLGYEMRSDCVRLWVEDDGVGLSEEQQQQLFQPFQRLGRESSTIPGTGIGLVLSRELAQLMGGEIGFRSEEGQGSCFWVDLQSALPE